MRIITGNLKGRNFVAPRGHKTHPMSEKIRGAIFNALGDIEGLTLLDAFGGSGAISFEALSRGAISALAVDVSKDAHSAMQKNAETLKIGKSFKAILANVSSWSATNQHSQFDLVVADSPYDDISERTLEVLKIHVKPDGLYILSLPKSCEFAPEGFKFLSKKTYDQATVGFYQA